MNLRLLAYSALLFCALAFVHHVQAAESGPAPKIAVLRLEEVMRKSVGYKSLGAELDRQQGQAEAAIKQMNDRMQQIDNQLQVLKPENENFAKLAEEIETMKVRKKMAIERFRGEMERKRIDMTRSIFRTVNDGLAAYAKERGIMLVVRAPDRELTASAWNELVIEVGMQTSVYYDASLDITEPFIAFLATRPADSTPAEAPKAADKPADKPAETPATP